MRIAMTLIMVLMTCATSMAQTDTIPNWQNLTKKEQKAVLRNQRDNAYRERMREKSLQEAKKNREEQLLAKPRPVYPDIHWFAGIDCGSGMAFGDDAYDVFREFSSASGFNISGYVGYQFTRVWAARLRLRHEKLYSRVNLETYNSYKSDPAYVKYFPREGFYGYNVFSTQAEVLINLSNACSVTHTSPLNVFAMFGTGVNVMSNYDENVKNWTKEAGKLKGGYYNVDTGSHPMWMGTVGVMLDYRLNRNWSINMELNGNITCDSMEGVVSEEWFDVYTTYGLGITYHF